jgi:hypothetical protein
MVGRLHGWVLGWEVLGWWMFFLGGGGGFFLGGGCNFFGGVCFGGVFRGMCVQQAELNWACSTRATPALDTVGSGVYYCKCDWNVITIVSPVSTIQTFQDCYNSVCHCVV